MKRSLLHWFLVTINAPCLVTYLGVRLIPLTLSTALCESNSLSGQAWTKCPTRPGTQGTAPLLPGVQGVFDVANMGLAAHVKKSHMKNRLYEGQLQLKHSSLPAITSFISTDVETPKATYNDTWLDTFAEKSIPVTGSCQTLVGNAVCSDHVLNTEVIWV